MCGHRTAKENHIPDDDKSTKSIRGQSQNHTQAVPGHWAHNSHLLLTPCNTQAPVS